ncbi:DoxX family membrane protein [Kineococcus sp. R86509]|uniref:DoxX family membrane protein n=1 Tax=Kineococcus sp. R86509 TaxID=3093851 RepID=UPI0036D43778
MAHSLLVLRLSMGVVFLGFGVLKFFPGTSPAQDLAVTTTRMLTFGLVPDHLALIGVASLETVIGACLLLGGRFLPAALLLLVPQLAGILSPIVLLPHRLFAGPHHAPTLEGQYVLKDVILLGAALVIAAAFLGQRRTSRPLPAREKLAIVLAGIREECPLEELCAEHGISESDYRSWKDEVLTAAEAIRSAQAVALRG